MPRREPGSRVLSRWASLCASRSIPHHGSSWSHSRGHRLHRLPGRSGHALDGGLQAWPWVVLWLHVLSAAMAGVARAPFRRSDETDCNNRGRYWPGLAWSIHGRDGVLMV